MPISDYYRKIREKIGSDLIFTPAVVALIWDDQDRLLMVQEAGGTEWALPAGAIELGETPAQAVVREVHEETGLQVVPTEIRGVFGGEEFRWQYADGNRVEYVIVVFACNVTGGALQPVDGEIQAFRYAAPAELPPLPFPYARDMLERLTSRPAYFQKPPAISPGEG